MENDTEGSRNDPSCLACKRLKRKCSRDHPSCSLCRKTNRRCQYPCKQTADHDLASVSMLQNRIHELEDELSKSRASQTQAFSYSSPISKFKSSQPHYQRMKPGINQKEATIDVSTGAEFVLLFLDSVAYRNREPHLWQTIEMNLSQQTESSFNGTELQQIIQDHIRTTHVWLPILSIRRLWALVNNMELQPSIDANLLFMALHIMNNSDHHTDSSWYNIAKAGLDQCHAQGALNLNILAAEVILATFEMAHGIYPAAYMTASKCSRLSHMLGLHDPTRAVQVLPKPDTWMEREARRRLWWATIVLDRCVAVGFRFRPLSTTFLSQDEILPGSDDSWDEGEVSVNPFLVMTGQTNYTVAPFARTCQASHLLGRVVQHVNYEHGMRTTDTEIHEAEALQLHRALSSFIIDLDNEYNSLPASQKLQLCTSNALANSALLNLYDLHCCIEGDAIELSDYSRSARLEMQNLALQEQKRVATRVVEFAHDLCTILALEGARSVSPLICDCLYQAAAYYAWTFRETSNRASLDALNTLRQTLGLIALKWRVANYYLQLLDGTEYSYTGGCRF